MNHRIKTIRAHKLLTSKTLITHFPQYFKNQIYIQKSSVGISELKIRLLDYLHRAHLPTQKVKSIMTRQLIKILD
jgi:hypothetical protein